MRDSRRCSIVENRGIHVRRDLKSSKKNERSHPFQKLAARKWRVLEGMTKVELGSKLERNKKQ